MVVNATETRAVGSTCFFRSIYQRLSRDAYLNILEKLNDEFRATDPWVQALRRQLGVIMEIRGGTGLGSVEVAPEVLWKLRG